MATIKPFQGLRYNPEQITDLSSVVSQPYDRVRYGLQEKYYAQSEHTIVKIIKGKAFDGDNDTDNVYTRARSTMDAWLTDGSMLREDVPALYVLHQVFTLPNGETYIRKGFTAAFEIVTFDEGIVLPHERTLSGPKVDRLNLCRATETYFGHIFMLYPDRENRVNAILDAAIAGKEPYIVRELFESDVEQRFWIITDAEIIARVQQEMAPKKNLIIADGHHRYETAINFRDEMRSLHPDAPAEAGFNYRMVTLVGMSDPGLIILPTHRLMHSYKTVDSKVILEKARQYFEVELMADRAEFEAGLAAATTGQPRIGFYDGSYALLTFTEVAKMAAVVPERDEVWQLLDVSVLHELLIERVMGLSKKSIEAKENIDYLREVEMGYKRVDEGSADFMFVLNPTRMDQVSGCTAVDEKMPQKSTDFFPKIISGLVAMPVGPQERI